MILKCEHVKKQFGKLHAVDNLSFEVEEGVIFGIAGTNGSGKTTTFNLITGRGDAIDENASSGPVFNSAGIV
jgi:ABC-type branched-subunit amino acid transport system ATPase component